MPMREDCRNFQSRTYASGEVARWCALDLAPEAPWRCPDNCGQFALRRTDVAWQYGSLTKRPDTPDEPDTIRVSDEAAALLDQAEDIINLAGPQIVEEVQRQRQRQQVALRPGSRFMDRIRDRFRRR